MMLFAGLIFFGSLFSIVFLLAMKASELETGRYLAPRLRQSADLEALRLKELLLALHADLKKVWPLTVYWIHMVGHYIALEFARMARVAALSSHAFATFLSKRRRLDRTHSRSEFLRRMAKRPPRKAQKLPAALPTVEQKKIESVEV